MREKSKVVVIIYLFSIMSKNTASRTGPLSARLSINTEQSLFGFWFFLLVVVLFFFFSFSHLLYIPRELTETYILVFLMEDCALWTFSLTLCHRGTLVGQIFVGKSGNKIQSHDSQKAQ